MAIENVMDAIAKRLIDNLATASASGTPGLRAAYSSAATGQGGAIIPRTTDDWPVAIVWTLGGDLTAGNGPEPFVHRLEVQFWANAMDAAYAYQTLIPFVDRCRQLFRTDLDAAAQADRVLMLGYDMPETDQEGSASFLVLPVFLEVLEIDPTNGYAL